MLTLRRAAAAAPLATPLLRRALATGHGHGHGTPAASASSSPAKTGDALPEEPPGAPPGAMPSNLEQATGREREEYLAALKGFNLFEEQPKVAKHFGTKKNPVVVFTHFDERVVGCQGPCPFEHEAGWGLWWNMKVNTDKRCPECGQYFQLRKDPHAHEDEAHGHH
eukprot:Unigene3393_Nuclearia_a/m.10400 Unigene3393_Nuclearia_a/g.10400  ORF Unigene3393_Nuclearia_a/g.10400 Unigene3393_Nuclearia_a/m.10400 type:complete len:166 (-) Unigene3393_Nuclearia_a:37-534(-)